MLRLISLLAGVDDHRVNPWTKLCQCGGIFRHQRGDMTIRQRSFQHGETWPSQHKIANFIVANNQ
ncbi:Uncharacterised protein [Vibrio cholerae]|nr:Uncharacterised protein [Vibrio cholerae]